MDSISNANLTSLTHAVTIGDDASVLFLLETGADPEELDSEGRSALSLAVDKNHLKSAAYLLEHGAMPDAADGTGRSPLQIARERNSTGAINLLSGVLAEVRREQRRPKRSARRRFRWAYVGIALLYAIGAALVIGVVQLRSTYSVRASDLVFDAVAANDVSGVSRLLLSGTSPDTRDKYGTSALQYAANVGRIDIVRILLKNHADPNLTTKSGIASLSHSGIEHADIIEALLESGADPNRKDDRGRTLLAYACASPRYGQLIDTLLKHKANPNVSGENGPPLVSLIECGDGVSLDTLQALVDAHANPNASDSAGTPVIVWAAEQGDEEIVKLLLHAGAKVGAADRTGRTALDTACRAESAQEVEALLARGADPNLKDKDGNTAAMYAIAGIPDRPGGLRACTEIVRILANHGAVLNAANNHGETPVQFAASIGADGLSHMLERD